MSRDNNMYHDEEGGYAVDSDDEPEFWDRGGGFEIEVGEDEGEGDEDNVDDNYDVQEGNVHIDKIGIGEVLMPSDLGYIHNKRECLSPGHWLNDEVINFYCQMLQARHDQKVSEYNKTNPDSPMRRVHAVERLRASEDNADVE